MKMMLMRRTLKSKLLLTPKLPFSPASKRSPRPPESLAQLKRNLFRDGMERVSSSSGAIVCHASRGFEPRGVRGVGLPVEGSSLLLGGRGHTWRWTWRRRPAGGKWATLIRTHGGTPALESQLGGSAAPPESGEQPESYEMALSRLWWRAATPPRRAFSACWGTCTASLSLMRSPACAMRGGKWPTLGAPQCHNTVPGRAPLGRGE